MRKTGPRTKKEKRTVKKARIYITATFNNTIVTVTDLSGNVLFWNSAGASGFRGARKSTPHAASVTVSSVLQKAKEYRIEEVEVYLKGPGPGRDSALRALKGSNLKVTLIADITPIPHNGVRPKKKRRV